MADKDQNALVVQLGRELQQLGSGSKAIIADMVTDVLSLTSSRSLEVAVAKFRLGEYELCEPDHKLILMWAAALDMQPEDVIERLVNHSPKFMEDPSVDSWELMRQEEFRSRSEDFVGSKLFEFKVENGSIVSLTLNFLLLPLPDLLLNEGLQIQKIGLLSMGHHVRFPHKLTSLREFNCYSVFPIEFDFANVPNLEILRCDFLWHESQSWNSDFDLSKVPALKELCVYLENSGGGNCLPSLRKLDFSQVPHLSVLRWSGHYIDHISNFKFSKVPRLTVFECNEYGEFKADIPNIEPLTLPPMPELKEFRCRGHQLKVLDVSNAAALTILDCGDNFLSSLDVSNMLGLTELYCDDNVLRTINLFNVPTLAVLECDGNIGRKVRNLITDLAREGLTHVSLSLDLSCVPLLTKLTCESASFDLSYVPLLTSLSCGPCAPLDLSGVPLLTNLTCNCTSLDLSCVPLLTSLSCGCCASLDLSSVPMLTSLSCGTWDGWGVGVRQLDLSMTPLLRELSVCSSSLDSLDISHLKFLDVCFVNRGIKVKKRRSQVRKY